MDYTDNTISIGEVVAALPAAAVIFKEYGIDFCCGGHRPLAEVIKQQGVSREALIGKLQAAAAERTVQYNSAEKQFNKMSSGVLSAYIEDTHHGYLRETLPKISELLNTILRVHGKNHRELFEMYRLFGRLKADLEQHLLKEENLLFPVLEKAAENRTEIIALTDEIITEHEAAGEILRELRKISGDYELPEGACNTYRNAYALLIELEEDLHQHIHLENNILLKEYSNRR